MNFWTSLWTFVNSPFGIAVVAAVLLFLLNLRYAKPIWQKYQGTIIAGVKWAEKMIPDNTENKAVARLDEALRYVVQVFEEVKRRQPTPKEVANLKEGIQVTHAEMESSGALK